LLATYLIDILPFRSMINPAVPKHSYLFGDANGPFNTDQITNTLKIRTQMKLGLKLTLRDYRHISIAMDRKFIRGDDLELDQDDEYLDNAHDLMSAHSTRIATNRYGRLAGLLRELSPESIDLFCAISDKSGWRKPTRGVGNQPIAASLPITQQPEELWIIYKWR